MAFGAEHDHLRVPVHQFRQIGPHLPAAEQSRYPVEIDLRKTMSLHSRRSELGLVRTRSTAVPSSCVQHRRAQPGAVRAAVGEVTEAIVQRRIIATDVGVTPDFVDDVEAHFRLDIR